LIQYVVNYRYYHKEINVYNVAEEVAQFLSDKLKLYYPRVFYHLKNIVQANGFTNNETTMRTSLFISFVITRENNIRPLVDQDDYNLRFILWLHEGILFYMF